LESKISFQGRKRLELPLKIGDESNPLKKANTEHNDFSDDDDLRDLHSLEEINEDDSNEECEVSFYVIQPLEIDDERKWSLI
jgi:hypothetical protein